MIPTPSRLLGMHCSCPDRPSSTCDAAVVPESIAASAPSAHSAPVGAILLVAIYVAIGRYACVQFDHRRTALLATQSPVASISPPPMRRFRQVIRTRAPSRATSPLRGVADHGSNCQQPKEKRHHCRPSSPGPHEVDRGQNDRQQPQHDRDDSQRAGANCPVRRVADPHDQTDLRDDSDQRHRDGHLPKADCYDHNRQRTQPIRLKPARVVRSRHRPELAVRDIRPE